jgi:7-cyano-7-deazaguanine synthase
MPEPKQVVVLVSGGMDSVTALHWAVEQHQVAAAVSFDYGAKHNSCELPLAAAHAARLGVPHICLPLHFIKYKFEYAMLLKGGAIPRGHYEAESMKQTVVPFRNGIMLAVAAGLAESRGAASLVIAAHAGDHAIYPDCRESFMLAMAAAIREGTYAGIELLRPFIAMDKASIVREGQRLGVPFKNTWSCYVGGRVHCGSCGTCVERREAFIQAGVTDPTIYASNSPLPAAPTA